MDEKALLRLFGSSKAVARAAGVDKAAVVRWRQRKHPVAPLYQARLIEAARRLGLDEDEVAAAIDVPQCPACGHYHILPF